MFNPIEEKRRLVQERIAKSFDSGINLSEEMSLEKAKYQVGQPHPNNPNILWTEWQPGKFDWKSKNGRYWKGKTGGVSNKKAGANATDNEFKNVEFHHGQYYFNMGVDKHNYVILKKLSDKQVAKYKEYQEKRNKDALDAAISQAINDWKNTTNVDTPKKEKAWKKIVDKISVKRAHGYALTNEENYYWGMEQGGKRADSSTLLSSRKSDPRDKIAQDGGFKDYEEMKGYQDYVTQKNLLKKKSTKAGMRLLYQQEVAKYEKDHADLIKRIGSNSIKAYKKVEAKKNTKNKTQSPQDKVKDIMQQFDDTTMDEDEFDEYVDSVLGNDMGQKLRKEILNRNKSFSDKKQAYKDAVEMHLGLKLQKYSDMDIKDAKKALVGKVVTLSDYWPDGRGGSQDAIGEIKNVRLYGKNKTPIAEVTYPNGDEQMIRLDEIDDGKMKDSYKTPVTIGDDKKKLDAIKNKITSTK